MDSTPYCDYCFPTVDGELCFLLSHPWLTLLFGTALYFLWIKFIDPIVSKCAPSDLDINVDSKFSCDSMCESAVRLDISPSNILPKLKRNHFYISRDSDILSRCSLDWPNQNYNEQASSTSSLLTLTSSASCYYGKKFRKNVTHLNKKTKKKRKPVKLTQENSL